MSVARLRYRHRDSTLRRLLAFADIAAITAALSLATLATAVGTAGRPQLLWALLTIPAWVVLFKVYGLYDRDAKRVSHSTVDDVPSLFHALVVGGLGLWLLFKLAPAPNLVLRQGVVFFSASFVGVLIARAGARALARLTLPAERAVFVGAGPMSLLLIEKIRSHPEYALEPIGYVDTSETQIEHLRGTLPYLGGVLDLAPICERAAVDRVVVVAPAVDDETLAEVLRRTKNLDVRISILPNVADVLGPSVEIDHVEGVTVLGVNPPALTRSSRFLKRTMDVVVASVVLVLALPAMLAIAAAIRLTSPGPVLFSQDRVGRGGQRFRIYKFRTMVVDAEERAKELAAHSAHPAWLLLENDPRITRVGHLLRHWSLDELPQLWNVVRGDMSLVGPRPMPPDVDEKIHGWRRRRLDLTPGITGFWQVLGRTNIPFEEMVKLDYLYVTNWSLWQDVRLLIQTLPAVIRRRGAN
jgi:exopolysaccharide biosynthesis polyprenyl glycosylphosphotransferase